MWRGPVVIVGNLVWIKVVWEAEVKVCHDQPPETLHNGGSEPLGKPSHEGTLPSHSSASVLGGVHAL